jgi:HlyD family secretion protein
MSHQDTTTADPSPTGAKSDETGGPLVPAGANLPATLPPPAPHRRRRPWARVAFIGLALIAAAAGGAYWYLDQPVPLPAGIASGNGRLEADEIDIDTKFASRVARLLADEGDRVKAGQIVAEMDVRDLEAQLAAAQATVRQAGETLSQARANVTQQQTQVVFARQELTRAEALTSRGFMSKEALDQRRQQMYGAGATLAAATAAAGAAAQAVDAAEHNVDLLKVNIADNRLVAPVDGRIEYKIANVGEVLPAGGKVFTMLDTSYVYMDIYLPTEQAGKVRLGGDCLIVLDALPEIALPAKVTYLATEAQFTPKAVETKTERDKLMFRVKLRVDPPLMRKYAAEVRTGLPGVGYVRLDDRVPWPQWLSRNIIH